MQPSGVEQAERRTECREAGECALVDKEALLWESLVRAEAAEARLAAERVEREGREAQRAACAPQLRCEALAEEARALRTQGEREAESESKEQLAGLVERLTWHAKAAEEARLELAGQVEELSQRRRSGGSWRGRQTGCKSRFSGC